MKSSYILMRTLVLITLILPAALKGDSYIVTDFGADPAREGEDTEAIQAAVDAAFEAGGGHVLIPPGDYESGPIFLKDNVTFEIGAGATLWASPRFEAYFENENVPSVEDLANRRSLHTDYALLNGTDLKNARIIGTGTIHGQGKTHWWEKKRVRPYTIRISGGQNLRFEDVTTIESMFHTFNFSGVEGLIVRGITLRNEWRSPNTDGLHFMGCKFVHVSDVDLFTGDDCILAMGGTTDLTVTNSRFSTPYGVLWISNGDRITMSNCVMTCQMIIKDIRRANDVIVSDIVADGEGRLISFMGGPVTNLQMNNIIATGFSQGGWLRNGENITLNNIQITRAKGTGNPSLLNGLDFREIKNLSIRDVRMDGVEEGPALYCENVDDLELIGFRFSDVPEEQPAVELKNVTRAHVSRYFGRTEGRFLGIEGEKSADLILGDIHLRGETISIGDEVTSDLSSSIPVELVAVEYPENISANVPFSIFAEVKSLSALAGLFELVATVDGGVVKRSWMWLEPNQTVAAKMDIDALYAAGEYEIRLADDKGVRLGLETKPAEVVVEATSLSTDIASVGEVIKLEAKLKNIGSEVFSDSVTLDVAGRHQPSPRVEIAPGETMDVSLSFMVSEVGLHEVQVGSSEVLPLKIYGDSLSSTFADLDFSSVEGQMAHDRSGLDNHLKLDHLRDGKLPWLVDGRFGKALQFDGFTSYGVFDEQLLSKPMTIAMWVMMGELNEGSTAGRQMLLYAGEPQGTDGYGPEEETHLMHGTGNNFVWWSNAANPRVNVRAPIPDFKNYHHLVVVYDDTSTIYVNGEPVMRLEENGEPDYSYYADRLFFGRPTTERIRFFSGAIDDLKFFREPLTDEQVKELFDRSDN